MSDSESPIKYPDFAARLNELMHGPDSAIKTVRDIEKLLGITYEMARRYTKGIAKPRDEKLELLAQRLNATPAYLDHGDGIYLDNNVNMDEKIPLEKKGTPVISWIDAGQWHEVKSADLTEVIEYIPYNKDAGENGYGLIVRGYSMAPWFLPDDRIYVNPDLAPLATNEDLVIAMCNFETEATFKQLIQEMGEKYLIPLNKEWPGPKHIALDGTCAIKGLVVGLYRPVNKKLFRSAH